MGLLLLVIAINILIATYNARMVGRVWDLAKGFGVKVVLLSALAQSVIGYTSALIIGLGLGAYQMEWLDEKFFLKTVQLWYLLVIFPCIMTGFIVWLHGVIETLRNPTLGNVAGTAWNTFAMYHNISDAFENVPSAWEGVGELFKGGDSDSDGKGKIAIFIVVLTFIIGILLASVVFASGRRATRRELLEFQKKRDEVPAHKLRRHA